METLSNLASAATNTASKLIYGDQTKPEDQATTATNETAGKEPLSGEQGKGTVAEPFDQGNAATPLASTAGKSTFLDYSNNISSGTEPVSGEQGKGTVNEPFDQGNDGKTTAALVGSKDEDFLKLNPTLDGPESKPESTGEPKIYTNRHDETYTGMPIVPLNPDVATSGPAGTSSTTAESTGTTEKTGITDKVWKETPLDDISRSGAPGAGPSAPSHVTPAAPDTTSSGLGSTTSTTTATDPAIKTTAPDSVTAASNTYSPSATTKSSDAHGVGAVKDIKTTTENTPSTTENRDTPAWATTGVTSDASKSSNTGESKGLVGEKSARKSESGKSPELGNTTSNEEKDGKMSHLKEKLKNKLHIGSKDK